MVEFINVPAFIAGLPKAELHVHLVGSASAPTVLELARRHPDSGVPTEAEALSAFYEFTDFAHFIEVYIAVNSLIRTPEPRSVDSLAWWSWSVMFGDLLPVGRAGLLVCPAFPLFSGRA